jgi:predicted helicase
MNHLLIQRYLNELSDLRKTSGTTREGVVSEAFKDLLKGHAKSHDLIFIPQYELPKQDGKPRWIDGALVYDLRVPFGYWEAKDEEDDLDKEIAAKFRRGYPRDNIIFEDSKTAVLIQHGNEVTRCSVEDAHKLSHLLGLFFGYERPEVADFRKAVLQFQADLPEVLSALRLMIEKEQKSNAGFRKGAIKFLKHAQETINPAVTEEDVREMLIQHVLTEEIFSKVFDEDDFHRQNNVAKELYALEGLFFTGALKKNTLKGLEPYYNAIRTTAHQIATHTEKQTFLKVIYEGFYKVYNKKAADRLGVVYTPNEIVRFMIEGADWLCQKHFDKALIEKGVEILDPATGTGTFITELIDHFRGQPQKLRYKYLEELHANEVAILPYYVANLNIEATYAAINGYEEYPNLCFVDTLDNTVALKSQKGQHVGDLFGGVSEENVARIKRQNKKKISVIIGNPPYNANQLNENENNKNREYPEIDRRIKETYIAASTAQKTKLYDMYARFFRWASDRIDENGIVAFVSNSSFIDSRTYDGFRKSVVKDFNEIWIIDLKGNARTSGERRRQEGGNIFDDQIRVGVAVYFCVKRSGVKGCRIYYEPTDDYAKSDEKRDFLQAKRLDQRQFVEIEADANNNWINQTDNDFGSFIPLADKATKSTKVAGQEHAIFKTFSFGVVTNRDEWVYSESKIDLEAKVRSLIAVYNQDCTRLQSVRDPKERAELLDQSIKWTRAVKRDLENGTKYKFDSSLITSAQYRPYVKRFLYFSSQLNEMQNRMKEFFGESGQRKNPSLVFTDPTSQKPFMALMVDACPDMHLVGAAAGAVTVPQSIEENASDNITDWALSLFVAHYKNGSSKAKKITKSDVFHYVYAVLHDPIYREKYAQNLKREFPRIPFYADFCKWVDWGKRLAMLHIRYETGKQWKLKRVDITDLKSKNAGLPPKLALKADKDRSVLVIDSETELAGVPPEAWSYQLGVRSALEWVLDQYKEKPPKDQTIGAKFNTYHFADYKEEVIDLLMRVTRVSVETMEIVEAMRTEAR